MTQAKYHHPSKYPGRKVLFRQYCLQRKTKPQHQTLTLILNQHRVKDYAFPVFQGRQSPLHRRQKLERYQKQRRVDWVKLAARPRKKQSGPRHLPLQPLLLQRQFRKRHRKHRKHPRVDWVRLAARARQIQSADPRHPPLPHLLQRKFERHRRGQRADWEL